MKKILFKTGIVFFLSIAFISCKNKTQSAETYDIDKTIDKNFKVIISATVEKDDNFQVYYTNNEGEEFSEVKSVWIAVKGKREPQDILFTLPKDLIPFLIRVDLGINKEQNDIILKKISMSFSDNTFVTQGENIANFFRCIAPTKINFKTGAVNAVNQKGNRVEPVLNPHEIPVKEAIKNLLK